MSLFVPDRIYNTVYDIPITELKNSGIRLALLDIDNTLVTYDDAKPTEENLFWFSKLKQEGIDIVFLSNNSEERVREYADGLEILYFADVGKPITKYHKKAMKHFKVKGSECVGIGDQIFTDVLSAHLVGARAIKVSPIKDLMNPFTQFKRKCEIPFLKLYYKKHKSKEK